MPDAALCSGKAPTLENHVLSQIDNDTGVFFQVDGVPLHFGCIVCESIFHRDGLED
jgi:hypothetical protein